MIGLMPDRLDHVVVLGAHCDDIAIGAGGALLTVCQNRPGVRVDALVLCGAGTEREAEERAALTAFCPGADLRITVGALPDGRVPAHWNLAKEACETLRRQADPDLVLCPRLHDAHQDHRELALLARTAWRDHLILGYEIVKSDGDLSALPVHVPLATETARQKAELLEKYYPSQHGRTWYDPEVFLALARLRGVECGHRYAEAFELTRAVVRLGNPADPDAA
jgi:LmbE family N-acetylglucosaminyl deacetylase